MSCNKNQIKTFKNLEQNFSDFELKVIQLARDYNNLLKDFSIEKESLNYWEKIIEEWANDISIPLYIRKSGEKYIKGTEIKHSSGRILIPVDNGPAHWALSMAFNKNYPTLNEIKHEWIEKDKINVSMILSKKQNQFAIYKCTNHEVDKPNEKGWKVAHREPIGLNSKNEIENLEIEILKNHFKKFMNPKNMFLIPKKYSGLAEVLVFLNEMEK